MPEILKNFLKNDQRLKIEEVAQNILQIGRLQTYGNAKVGIHRNKPNIIEFQ